MSFTLGRLSNAAVYETGDLATMKADTRAYFKAQPIRVNLP